MYLKMKEDLRVELDSKQRILLSKDELEDRSREFQEEKEFWWPLAFFLFLPLGVLIFACWGCGFFITNELRQRRRTQVIKLAQKSVKAYDPAEPTDDMNFELVHCIGKACNTEPIVDDGLKITV